MGFNIDQFDAAQITFPTKKISVPELAEFFEQDDDHVWEIKALTGHDLAIVNEAVETASKTKAMLEAVGSGSAVNIKKGFQMYLNSNDDITPGDLIRRHKMLQLGSVPKCPENICVKLAHAKPTTFYRLTNAIIQMTGQGADLGK